ncbi:hypothetical protein [Alteromonas macleodii]|mgnify:CR=1 FL=1|uniref:hypothetical protein n=1 Tax=Alteromonas macleodii TaxID=28108 RepID=UPI001000805F|nr:hypothetical protein [Alteromonas macleodii]RUM31601.1 MAG: hypothetical protein DSY75_03270 [Alteromonas sp.]CAI2390227.1 hypothetical protein ALT831_02198 [Alteromonas macleodii]CAI3958059.1 hypothetical protein ALTBGP9_02128 [Alteromonas macleodii]CAI3959066.1 hypothetical protein ALTBGP14_02198 [Alteromonas macleodii]CAI3959075.1 hypothetical protein ALTBGP6_02198 [Alteromonas macleodii]|tara:strand:- start:1049 stop:1984 length:936 start_codon:yes stop_codon:yes gene_type:complete
MDYSYYFRTELSLDRDWSEYDLFLSVFNSSDRVNEVYNRIKSESKYWLIIPEYEYVEKDYPKEPFIKLSGGNESEQLQSLLKLLNLKDYKNSKVCVDLTGFMRPQMLFLLFYFKTMGFKEIDFVYSEPDHYIKKEKTKFSEGSIYDTRQIQGYAGSSSLKGTKDLLIIASGYDTNLIAKVAQYKESAEIVQILGFPSLRADMYQENVLRTIAAAESFTAKTLAEPIFAPASDPFETANVVESFILDNDCLEKFDHIYICPLSTKAQTLGIGLAYQNTFVGKPVSLLFPFTSKYSKETSVGISKVWLYKVEF